MVLSVGHIRKEIRNTGKVLKCGAGEGWKRSVRMILCKMKTFYVESRWKGISYIQ
jgi:hypothetical protein